MAPMRLLCTVSDDSSSEGIGTSVSTYAGEDCELNDGGSGGKGNASDANFLSSCRIMLCWDTLVT
jgi:hypothetical protein